MRAAVVPTVAIADASVVEGTSGSSALALPASLSTAVNQTVSVHHATSDGSVTGKFTTPTTISGTIYLADEANYMGTHFSCSSP